MNAAATRIAKLETSLDLDWPDSAKAAAQLESKADELTGGRLDVVRLDRAASARTSVGSAALPSRVIKEARTNRGCAAIERGTGEQENRRGIAAAPR